MVQVKVDQNLDGKWLLASVQSTRLSLEETQQSPFLSKGCEFDINLKHGSIAIQTMTGRSYTGKVELTRDWEHYGHGLKYYAETLNVRLDNEDNQKPIELKLNLDSQGCDKVSIGTECNGKLYSIKMVK